MPQKEAGIHDPFVAYFFLHSQRNDGGNRREQPVYKKATGNNGTHDNVMGMVFPHIHAEIGFHIPSRILSLPR